MWINLLHLLLILPLIAYVGWQMEYEKPIHEYVPRVMMAMGALGMAYHGYRMFGGSGSSMGYGSFGGYF